MGSWLLARAARLRAALVGLALAAPLYLLLIDTTSTPELIAGVVAAVLAASLYELAYAEGAGHAAFQLRWLKRAWYVVANVPPQILAVCREILAQTVHPRPVRGRLRAVEFRCTQAEPAEQGRRALAEALGSLAPNTIVIGVDPDRQLLLVHQLQVSGDSRQLDPLGLGVADSGR